VQGENNFKKSKQKDILVEFYINMEVTMGESIYKSIEDVDMIFFPNLQEKHYYLVIFDFKTPGIDVIDNMNGKMKARTATRVNLLVIKHYL